MVESTPDKYFSMKYHLFKAGTYGFKLFWVAGRFFIMKATVPPFLWHRVVVDLAGDAASDATGLMMHTCAFAALLAKNLVFKLVLLGGRLFTVCSNAAFAAMTDKERHAALLSSSVVDTLDKSFLYTETLVEGDWLKESLVEPTEK